MVKVECAWCRREYEESEVREITLLGRKFIICEDDFQLIWRGFGALNTLCTHLKASWAIRKQP